MTIDWFAALLRHPGGHKLRVGAAVLALVTAIVVGAGSQAQLAAYPETVQPWLITTTTTSPTWSFRPTITAVPPCGATPWDGGCG